MKTILRLTFLLAVLGGLTLTAAAAERASLQGILISASNEAGQTDRRLAQYESNLRRILRFESFRFLGDARTSLTVPASGTLSLGDGHQLAITTEPSNDSAIHVKVRWTTGGRTVLNLGLVLNPGVPAILGGPSTGNKGEVYAVILVGR
jgi:hypothetical protein